MGNTSHLGDNCQLEDESLLKNSSQVGNVSQLGKTSNMENPFQLKHIPVETHIQLGIPSQKGSNNRLETLAGQYFPAVRPFTEYTVQIYHSL